MPLAIKLRYPIERVFLANSSSDVWLFAKLHVLAADSLHHQLIDHLTETHLAIEPIAVAVQRKP
jgi:arachidonate 15-lipoxygenase